MEAPRILWVFFKSSEGFLNTLHFEGASLLILLFLGGREEHATAEMASLLLRAFS